MGLIGSAPTLGVRVIPEIYDFFRENQSKNVCIVAEKNTLCSKLFREHYPRGVLILDYEGTEFQGVEISNG